MNWKYGKYILCITLMATLSCTDFIAERDLQDAWEIVESPHIILHYREEGFSAMPSPAQEEVLFILDNQELYYRAVQDSIQRYYSDKILIYLYNQDEAAEHIGTGAGGHSIPKLNTFYFAFLDHTRQYTDAYGIDNPFIGAHELTHVISHQTLGYPGTKMMSEGYANWLDGSYAHYHIKDIVTSYRDTEPGKIMSPDELLIDTGRDESIYYPNVGVFTGFLARTYGIENINGLFNSRQDNFISDFERICNENWEDMTEIYNNYIENL